MAKILMSLDEAEDYLPMVCMVCGRTATWEKVRTFSWHPGWVFLLLFVNVVVYAVVAVILTKRTKIHVPVCDAHGKHWLVRNLFIAFGLLGVIASFVFALVLNDRGGRDWLLLVALGLFLVWLVVAIVLGATMVKPTLINEYDIELTNVSAEFVNALEERDEVRREKRRQRLLAREADDDRRLPPPLPERGQSENIRESSRRPRDEFRE